MATAYLDRPIAIAVADLDGFKQVNDEFGHGVGDLVLHEIAQRLRRRAGKIGLVARLGGDEFATLVPLAGRQPAEVASHLRAAAAEPVDVGQAVIPVAMTVGLAEVVGRADVGVLLGHADAAMYRARSRRLGVAVYDPRLDRATPIPQTWAGGASLPPGHQPRLPPALTRRRAGRAYWIQGLGLAALLLLGVASKGDGDRGSHYICDTRVTQP